MLNANFLNQKARSYISRFINLKLHKKQQNDSKIRYTRFLLSDLASSKGFSDFGFGYITGYITAGRLRSEIDLSKNC